MYRTTEKRQLFRLADSITDLPAYNIDIKTSERI